MLHGVELLQIQQLTFEQPEEILYHRIVQTVTLAAHALANTFLPEHLLVLFVLVLPAQIGMKNQVCSVRNLYKRLVQHWIIDEEAAKVVRRIYRMGSYCSLFCSCNRLRCGIVSKWIIWQSYRYSHIE